ncbi:BAH-domain-containing protein, partial [Wilcoxina mikolae CBS 423.85]
MPVKRKRSTLEKAESAAAALVSPEPESPGDGSFDSSQDDNTGAGGALANAAVALAISECPYSVEFRNSKGSRQKRPKAAKRSKVSTTTTTTTTDGGPPPHQDLDKTPPEDNATVFIVRPEKQWQQLKKYRNFVVGTETFALNEYVFINHTNIPHGTDLSQIDDSKFWVARVLEIRAEDEAHVYLRVYWMYWPEELPSGRQYYHGAKELVASNHMEIVDAMTVSGRANVKHWLELDEDEDLPDLFWRQKFDYPTQSLTDIRQHCRCHKYYNPDHLMVGCPNTKCKIWLHEQCILDDIKRKVLERGGGPPAELPTSSAAAAPESEDSAENTIAVSKAPPKRKGGAKGSKGGLFQSAVDSFVTTTTTPTPETPEKQLTTTTTTTTPANGKSATKKKTKKEIENELDKIKVTYITGSSKVLVKDLRGLVTATPSKQQVNGGKKKRASAAAAAAQQVVEEEAGDEGGDKEAKAKEW